jgi:hypothetical protein
MSLRQWPQVQEVLRRGVLGASPYFRVMVVPSGLFDPLCLQEVSLEDSISILKTYMRTYP